MRYCLESATATFPAGISFPQLYALHGQMFLVLTVLAFRCPGSSMTSKSTFSFEIAKFTKVLYEQTLFLLAGLLSVRYAPVSEGTKACKEAKA